MPNKRYTDDEVILALMSHDTVRAAAAALGCSTRTVYNYVSQDGFAEKIEAARSARMTLLADMMDNTTAQALDCLCAIMTADTSGLMPDVTVAEQLEAARIVLAHDCRRSAILKGGD